MGSDTFFWTAMLFVIITNFVAMTLPPKRRP
jgi:hypothetical protein